MHRLAPPFLLVCVTGLLGLYGHAPWSWAAGPLVSLALWGLDRKAREPAAPAPARTRARPPQPAPVD